MPTTMPPRSRDAAVLIAAIVWLLAFGGHFFAQPVASDVPLGRLDVLADSGWMLLDHVLPPADGQARNSGWRYLPQRFDLLFVSATMALAAWSAGELLLRALRIEPATKAERIVFACGLGISAWTLATLGLGLAGLLWRPLFVVLMLAAIAGERTAQSRQRRAAAQRQKGKPANLREQRFLGGPRLPIAVCLAVAPFLLAMLLGAMLPTTDFDVKEYHLQGPKEWHQQGQITFLPHNVYTSFPFLTEMLSLWGMVLRGDWYRGALIGQVVLMTFAPLTAVAIYAIARRFSTTAGWLGVGVFLTIPWVYRISVTAYAEGGLTFFLAATFVAWLSLRRQATDANSRGGVLLCGLLAGSALGCKYPGLVSVAIPVGLAVVLTAARQRGAIDLRAAIRAAAAFSLGAAITFGPWALKNLVQTGNPVYPLGYTVFGGADWTPELNDKWRNGHKSPTNWRDPAGLPADVWQEAENVAVNSAWQSPLVFAFAPLALLTLWPRRPEVGVPPSGARKHIDSVTAQGVSSNVGAAPTEPVHRLTLHLILYSAWLFLTWWGLTHRIDRFWLPMLPIVCALAGIGGAALIEPIERMFDSGRARTAVLIALTLTSLSILATAYNLVLATSAQGALNTYLLEESAVRRLAMRQTPSIALLEARLPAGARVLSVGEAAVFDATFELRYNTVFDFELLQAWATDDPRSLHQADIPLKPRDEIVANLRAAGITHVFVNWLEIARYREPGSYTYTDFISPRTMRRLVDDGVLNPVRLTAHEGLVRYADLSPQKQQVIDAWGPELVTSVVFEGSSIPAVTAYELYSVADKTPPSEP